MAVKLLRIKEVAALIDVPVQRGYELARTGGIPGVVRFGRQIRVDPDRLQRFLESGGAPLNVKMRPGE
jgi:excisionase family DNA binding protein